MTQATEYWIAVNNNPGTINFNNTWVILSGTVDMTTNTTSVVGTTTSFDTELTVGQNIKIGTEIFRVKSIGSATTLTTHIALHNTTLSGVTVYKNTVISKLPNIQDMRTNLSTDIDASPIPTFGSTGNIGITYAGTRREISIEGVFIGTATEIADFIQLVESKLDGSQLDMQATPKMGYHFHNALMDARMGYATGVAQYRVAIRGFTHNYEAGIPAKLVYQFNLIEIREI